MDNLWVYLILIFGYVGYSLVKSARKQREGDGEESEEERFFSEEQDLRRNLNDVFLHLFMTGVRPPVYPGRKD